MPDHGKTGPEQIDHDGDQEETEHPLLDGRFNRRRFLYILGGAGAAALGYAGWNRFFPRPVADGTDPRNPEHIRNSFQRGAPRDGIPAILRPRYENVAAADSWLNDGMLVFAAWPNGEPAAYPEPILVWHEIVVEEHDDQPLNLTYCPLTGSPVAFLWPSGGDMSFGVSGLLYNSNLVMYDHQTDSRWPQLLGTAVAGPRSGDMLPVDRMVTTTWGRWKATYPEGRVLSRETGHNRSYGVNPYGDYNTSDRLFFPVSPRDPDRRFHPKKVVYGVRLDGLAGDQFLAVDPDRLARDRLNVVQGDEAEVVLVWDEALAAPRGYSTQLDGRRLEFELENGHLVDMGTGSRWNMQGLAVEGEHEGRRLQPAEAFDVMWFAWFAFYPETEVYA